VKLAPILPPPGLPDEMLWLINAINTNLQDLEQLTRRGLRVPLGSPGLPSIGFQNTGFDGIGGSGLQDGITGAVQGILWEGNTVRQRASSPSSGAASEVVPNGVPDAGGTPARVSALETDVQADPENYSRVEIVAGTDMKLESLKRGTAALRDLVLGVDDGTFTEAERIKKTETVINETGSPTMDFRVESDTDPNMIFVDASADKVGIGEGTPTSTFDIDGSLALPTTNTSIDITLDATHFTVLVDATGAARIVTLPTAASVPGRVYVVKKTDVSANTVTIDPAGAELIDGAASKVLGTQWQSIAFQSNGTSWYIIADPISGAGGSGVTIRKNSGANVGTETRLNLIEGANITITAIDDPGSTEVDITIAATAGAVDLTQFEKNLTSIPSRSGSFHITDAALVAGELFMVTQAPGPYTGKGTLEDEAEMDQLTACGFIDAGGGGATIYWNSPLFVKESFKFNYVHGS